MQRWPSGLLFKDLVSKKKLRRRNLLLKLEQFMFLFSFALLGAFVLERLQRIRSAVKASSEFQAVGIDGRGCSERRTRSKRLTLSWCCLSSMKNQEMWVTGGRGAAFVDFAAAAVAQIH